MPVKIGACYREKYSKEDGDMPKVIGMNIKKLPVAETGTIGAK